MATNVNEYSGNTWRAGLKHFSCSGWLRRTDLQTMVFENKGGTAYVSITINNTSTDRNAQIKITQSDGIAGRLDATDREAAIAIPNEEGKSPDVVEWTNSPMGFSESFADVSGATATVVPGGKKRISFTITKRFWALKATLANDAKIFIDGASDTDIALLYVDNQRDIPS